MIGKLHCDNTQTNSNHHIASSHHPIITKNKSTTEHTERWHQTRNWCSDGYSFFFFFPLQIGFGPPPKWQLATTLNVFGFMSTKNHNISQSNLT